MTGVVVDGRVWKPFVCVFDSADGVFMFTIHALSHEHAELLLIELKATARLYGEFVMRVE